MCSSGLQLQSRIHEAWTRFFVSTFEDRLRYTPSRCFETFPFPEALDADPELEASEARVDETLLRLVDTGKSCVGLAIVGDATKVRIEGAISDEVWNRLHAELGKTNPR